MKLNRLAIIFSLTVLALVLSACGAPPATSWPGLAADSETAYLANGSAVVAIRLKDGEELWSFPEKPGAKWAFYANPVFTTDGHLLVGSSGTEHTLFLVDAQTGNESWSFSEAGDHWVASPLVVGDIVYAPNSDGTLYVFDLSIPADDKLVWKIDLGGKLWSQPVTDGQRVYVAALDHHVHAVDIATHELVWVVDLEGASTGAPATANGLLYVGLFGSSFEALNTTDGSIAWTVPTQKWVWGGPTLDGETLYFADMAGFFYSVNAINGKLLSDPVQPDGAILASPVLFNGRIIIATENLETNESTVFAISADGSIESLETMRGKLYTMPVIAGNLILVAPFQGDFLLMALDADGKQVWQYPAATK